MWGIVLQLNPFGKKKWAIILTNLCFQLSKLFISSASSIAKSVTESMKRSCDKSL